MTDATATPTRTPLRGSCHCGNIQYVVFFDLPHRLPAAYGPDKQQRLQRCNCTVCHKTGHFHVKPASPSGDFLLLSPQDPFQALGDYTWGRKLLHFLFCKTCGVQCFVVMGPSKLEDVDLSALGVTGQDIVAGEKTTVWRIDKDREHVKPGSYVSVNGHTINAGQGFDMIDVVREKQVHYLDYLNDNVAEPMFDEPQLGGCF